MAQDYQVPIALIRRLCYPSGTRLPKLQRLEFPPKPTVIPITSYRSPIVRSVSVERGNLSKELYEFYVGKMDTNANVATCRWCGTMIYGQYSWETHGKAVGNEYGCKRILKDFYRTLTQGAEHECVACDTITRLTAWGVPLCSKKCEQVFMFEIPLTLRYELAQYRRELEAVSNATVQS